MAVSAPARPGPVRPNWKYRARQLAWAGIDLLFPPACGGCQRPGQRFCEACRNAVHLLGPAVCTRCGFPGSRHGPCRLCRTATHAIQPLTGLRSAAFFDGPLQAALHQLKYQRDLILADTLAHYLVRAWLDYGLPAGWVVPVPLSDSRLRQRGYNQAGLLARALAELAGLPYLPDAAQRSRDTATQVGLSAEARRTNVQGAFSAKPARVRGRVILLVDDVCTTGATLAACAEAMCQAGAEAVWGLSLARTPLPPQPADVRWSHAG